MKVSLLLVEDDREASEIVRTLMAVKLPQVAIEVAENGAAGVEMCRRHAPDIVITDINMPDMDGLRMVQEIKEMKPDTKFIVITGYSNRREQFDALGIHDYFVKPTDFKKLLVSIQTCISELTETRA